MDNANVLTSAERMNWRASRAARDDAAIEMMLGILARAGRWTAIAALVLDGEPDGFAMSDVSDVITAAGDESQVATKGGPTAAQTRALAERLHAIAARLARIRSSDGSN